ncbi:MAG: hypothetical protein ACRCW2_11360 [Cellulosilyticaceae bacterium]
MLGELGNLLGWFIIISYGLALINFCFKIINKRFKVQLNTHPKIKKIYHQVMKFVMKNHHIFGSMAAGLIILHLSIQWYTKGILLTGVIAALLILAEVIGGIVGAAKKWKQHKLWLAYHRMVGILIAVAIVIHLLVK